MSGPLSFDDLAPYTIGWPCEEVEQDQAIDTAHLIRVLVDGVEYITDRYVLVRRDQVEDEPHGGQIVQEAPDGSIGRAAAQWLVGDGRTEPGLGINPFYLDLADQCGLTVEPHSATIWRLVHDGEQIGIVNGYSDGFVYMGHGRYTIRAYQPGDDLTRLRRIVPLLCRTTPDRRAQWSLAAAILHALDGDQS